MPVRELTREDLKKYKDHLTVGKLKKFLEEADELIRLANLGYSEGEINFINYLDQVKTAVTTRVAYYEGLFNLNSSISELEKLIYASLRGEDYLK